MNELLKFYLESGADCVYRDPNHADNNMSADDNGPKSISRIIADGCNSLEMLYNAISNFEGCDLKKTALNTVIYDGSSNAEIMLIGEAPGQNEDVQGIPFCGQSGKLLDNMMLAIGYGRKDLYITNTVFWRPPGNRRPTPEEIEICRPFLEKHVALIKPKLILLIGSVALEAMLHNKQPMSTIRQTMLSYNNKYLTHSIPTVVLFHPSYLLRQPGKKKDSWQDLQFVKHFLDKKAA